MIYEPLEDSFLLSKYVSKFARGKVLDVGCGSGILIKAALTKSKDVIGIDIDNNAIEYCKKQGLNVSKSDLFSNIKGKFDVIIFNPPYLPQDEIKDLDLVGGKHGWELIERFFKNVGKHLNNEGEILILFSNLTNKRKVDSIIKESKFKFELLEEKAVGLMERLYVYRCYLSG